jgi:hypothetical protein
MKELKQYADGSDLPTKGFMCCQTEWLLTIRVGMDQTQWKFD